MRTMPVSAAIDAAGGVTKLAKAIGLHHSTILGWKKLDRIPAERVADVSRVTGLPKATLRPDLFGSGEEPRIIPASPAGSA